MQQSPWKSLPALLRLRLSLVVASSALAVFLYHGAASARRAGLLFAGVFLLAAAASALNQYQEQRIDSRMQRTRGRPLPQGRIGNAATLLIAFIAGLSGLFMLFFKGPPAAGVVALATLTWYNVVYTPLKRKSRYAVFIGAIAGALPPMIGWTAAGGSITVKCAIIFLFMYLWQIAHFLLLQLKYGREYERAGLPSLAVSTNEERFKIMVFIWILGTAGGALLLSVFHVLTNAVLTAVLIVGVCLFVLYFHTVIIRYKKEFAFAPAFRSMYLFQGFVFTLLIAQGLLIRSI